jgi:hypothetical protein
LSGKVEYHGARINDDLAVPEEIQAINGVGPGCDVNDIGVGDL